MLMAINTVVGFFFQVRKTPSWPRSWANSSLNSCIPTGMYGPTCLFWANLTPGPFLIQGFWMGGMEESAYAYWKVAIPVVVFGAPCGAWLASYCHRLVLAWFV